MSSYYVQFFLKKYHLNVKETFFFSPVQTFFPHATCGPKLGSVMGSSRM